MQFKGHYTKIFDGRILQLTNQNKAFQIFILIDSLMSRISVRILALTFKNSHLKGKGKS